MAIGWWLATFGVVKVRGWELSEFSWWIGVPSFVTCYFGLLYEKSTLVSLASRRGRLLPGFPHGATLMPGICQGGKIGLVFGEILNFSFGLVFWHTRHRPSTVYWYIDELMWGWSTGRIWQLPAFWVCVLCINLCQVKSVRFVALLLEFLMYIT